MENSIDLKAVTTMFDDKGFFNAKHISKKTVDKTLDFEGVIHSFRKVIEDQAGECVCSAEVLKYLNIDHILSSGIESLDCILNGGFMFGNIYEICGLSAVGKSQLCMTIGINIACKYEVNVHFIDCGGNASAKRMSEILISKTSSGNVRKNLERINITNVTDIYELITTLHNVKDNNCNNTPDNCRLIVIDSLTALYLPLMSFGNTHGLALLNHLSALVKYISVKCNVIFVIATLCTKNLDNGIKLSILGRYWLHVPNTRFLLSKQDNDALILSVLHSDFVKIGESCVLHISNKGVTV